MQQLTCLFILIFSLGFSAKAQQNYWQQQADYTLRVKLQPSTNILEGYESLVYSNNSPDTLHQLYYHLYYNAFQPGSEMDIRSRTIQDPDKRVGDRISKLKEDEIGEYFIKGIEVNHQPVTDFTVRETNLEIKLPTARKDCHYRHGI